MKIRRRSCRGGAVMVGLMLIGFLLGPPASSHASSQKRPETSAPAAVLEGRQDLAGPRSPQVQHFFAETRLIRMGFDGRRIGTVTYWMKLRCEPAASTGKANDEYTCRRFFFQRDSGQPVTVPALAGWTYAFRVFPTGQDERGQVLGIPHAKFEDLVDSRGAKLPPDQSYLFYNHFIDFHSFNDLLSRPTPGGKGIQDLTRIGEKIVHSAAFTEPPVNLGTNIKEGSSFRNGEMTMELKGLGLADGAPCAIVGYDSGESRLRMIMAAGGKDIVTEGGSEYAGDMWIDLQTRWLRRLSLNEFVVTETVLPEGGPMGGTKIDAYNVRHLTIHLISREEYEKD
jgi:hypothetical protein